MDILSYKLYKYDFFDEGWGDVDGELCKIVLVNY